MAAPLNLADFPDSPYARELERKPRRLRFDADLERQFERAHLERVKRRVRVWAAVVLAMTFGFGAEPLLEGAAWSLTGLAYFAGQLPLAVALAFLVWSRGYERRYMAAARFIVPLLHVSTAYFTARSMAVGASVDIAVLVLAMLSVFYFTGLLFRTALTTSVLTVGAFLAAGLALGLPQDLFLKSLMFIVLTGGLAGVMYRDVELTYRRAFLEEALVSELLERDGLTALKNRRAFDEHTARLWQQAARERSKLAFLFIDVDYFKAYNDEYGHQAGDATLRRVAQVVQRFAQRPLDMAARFGGEEFAVVLYDVEPTDVSHIAEALRGEVEGLGIEHRASGCARVVTASIGAGVVEPAADRTPAGAVQLADQALYQAKDAGRNRCVVNGSEEYATLVTGVYGNAALRAGRGRAA